MSVDRDVRLVALIRECQSLANALAMENDDLAAAHVLNATVDLRRAYTQERRQDLDRSDAQRAEELRRPYAV